MRIRALTVRQPWASLIASEEKTVEVRRFALAPGPLLICAGTFRSPEQVGDGLPRGVALCIVNVERSTPMTPEHEPHARCGFRPGRTANFVRVTSLVAPVKVRGMPGIFPVDLPDEAIVPRYVLRRSAAP